MSSSSGLSPACQAFWQGFLQSLAADDPRRQARPDAFAFAGGGALGDALLALVLAGRKRATTSLPVEYTALGEALPQRGDLSIVLDSRGEPAAIIERTDVSCLPFEDVDADHAAWEGEGDGSLQQWREGHAWYFGRVCQTLGGSFGPHTPVLCQRFRRVWP